MIFAGVRDSVVLVTSVVEGLGVGEGDGDGTGDEVGKLPCHSTQYSLPTTSAEQSTPGLKAMNCASVMLHESDMDLQVSPAYAAHVKEQALR